MNIVFDPEKHFLGKLCRHGHEWEDTGKSLRIPIKSGYHRCAVCVDLHNRRHTGNTEYYKKRYSEYGKAWHEKNCDRLREERKIYREVNKERIRERGRVYREQNQEAIRESAKRHYLLNRSKVLARTKKYHRENREADRQRRAIYLLSHADVLKKRRAVYLASPKGKETLRRSAVRRKVRKAGCHTYFYERNIVLARFENCCAYCGFSSGKLDIDHFIPQYALR